jgi:hypothetical protein
MSREQNKRATFARGAFILGYLPRPIHDVHEGEAATEMMKALGNM